eukprot:gene16252-biopygen13136
MYPNKKYGHPECVPHKKYADPECVPNVNGGSPNVPECVDTSFATLPNVCRMKNPSLGQVSGDPGLGARYATPCFAEGGEARGAAATLFASEAPSHFGKSRAHSEVARKRLLRNSDFTF